MARDPRKGGSTSKGRRGKKKSAPKTRSAPKRAQKSAQEKSANTSAAKPLRRRASEATAARAEIARLSRELSEALAQQTATSEVLQVISSSTGDIEPVFGKMIENATRVCGAEFGAMGLFDGEAYRRVALYNVPPAFDTAAPKEWRPGPEGPIGRVLRTGQVLRIDDLRESESYLARHPAMVAMVEVARARTLVIVPMLRDAKPIGVISIYRQEVRPFSERQIDLLKNFASQAVIAIENARLFNETREALEQQKASAEILRVISNSVADNAPVFEKILDSCERLFATEQLGIFLVQPDGQTQVAAWRGAAFETVLDTLPRPLEQTATGLVVRTGAVLHIPNTAAELDMPLTVRAMKDRIGDVSMAWAPMLGEQGGIGSISVMRQPPDPFSEKELALLKTFADQAVIAIQNTRLFREVQDRTNDLSEALRQQTATADVLKVISRSAFDLTSVLQTLVGSAAHLCEADKSVITRQIGEVFYRAEAYGFSTEYRNHVRNIPVVPERGSASGRALLEGRAIHILDVQADAEFAYAEAQKLGGFRTVLAVPILREGVPMGVLSLTRSEVRAFTDKQIELVSTFADQAAIAIENARLINEIREALERQTATADILKVIASSPDDVQPVFDAIADQSNRLLNGLSTAVYSLTGDVAHLMSFTPVNPAADAHLKASFPIPLSELIWGEPISRGEFLRVTDTEEASVPQRMRDMGRIRGWRSVVYLPLLSDGRPIGAISVTRVDPGSFADHHVQLLRTFADQAVIAISNVELFQQVQARTRELSQSLDDLRTAQDRLVQTEKLASLGQLTAGIAHEIKNPLNFVNNFSALSAELIDELDAALAPVTLDQKTKSDIGELTQMLKSNLEKVVQHGKRADSIVKNMLLHSREGSGERRSVDLNALVEESLNLAYHGARAERPGFQVTLKHDLDPDAGTIELYPQEITRVLLNMISNGFYAVTKRAGEAGNGFEPTLQAATKGLSDRVEIRIRDNGTGIPPEVKDKMFNPFFTTTPAGEGTGLGLSMSHDIVVKQHGGRIDVETEPGHFTEFIIVLPRANNFPGKSGG